MFFLDLSLNGFLAWSEADHWTHYTQGLLRGDCHRPSSAAACNLPKATLYEPPSNLRMAATYAGLGSASRNSYNPRLAFGIEVAQQEVRGPPRADAAGLGSVDL